MLVLFQFLSLGPSILTWSFIGFSGSSDGKESAHNAGSLSLIPVFRRPPLEKEMATHSSILACKIPWTEEPVWLQSIGRQRVRQA